MSVFALRVRLYKEKEKGESIHCGGRGSVGAKGGKLGGECIVGFWRQRGVVVRVGGVFIFTPSNFKIKYLFLKILKS
jgi:hypothetical protein